MYNEIRDLYITAAQRAPENDIDSNVQASTQLFCTVCLQDNANKPNKNKAYLFIYLFVVWFFFKITFASTTYSTSTATLMTVHLNFLHFLQYKHSYSHYSATQLFYTKY